MKNTADGFLVASIVLLTCSALVMTGFNVRRSYLRLNPKPPEPQYILDDWKGYAKGPHTGRRDAAVTVVVFNDYQCPACKALIAVLDEITRAYPRDVAVVVRHYPLPIHKYAFTAAVAAVCADDQGRFQQMHRLLYATTDSLLANSLPSLAAHAGVKHAEEFAKCLVSASAAEAVRADIADAKRLGIVGTPTILVNNEQYAGAAGIKQTVRRHVRKALKK